MQHSCLSGEAASNPIVELPPGHYFHIGDAEDDTEQKQTCLTGGAAHIPVFDELYNDPQQDEFDLFPDVPANMHLITSTYARKTFAIQNKQLFSSAVLGTEGREKTIHCGTM